MLGIWTRLLRLDLTQNAAGWAWQQSRQLQKQASQVMDALCTCCALHHHHMVRP